MLKKFFKTIGCILIIILSVFLVWYLNIFVLKTFSITGKNNDFYTGNATILAAIIAVVGVFFTIKHNNETKRKELLDNLDSKSEWRKQLYDVASKTILTTDDVYRVLASLRYIPKDSEDIAESKQKHFDVATREIFEHLYKIIKDMNIKKLENEYMKGEKVETNLSFENGEIVKIYVKYLLKHHWEYNQDNPKKYHDSKEKDDFYAAKQEIKYIKNNGIKCYLEVMSNLSNKRGCLKLEKHKK
ncbi:hypothetical protein [Staphylococcus equorum]|uniref:hypothetical protein n=1 Tax=Staphylococcus equorum TaxID=246432 RepID=UPI0037DA6A74